MKSFDRARQIEQLRTEQVQLLEAIRRRAQYIEHLQAIPPRRIRTTGRQAQANALQGGVSLSGCFEKSSALNVWISGHLADHAEH